jgi:exodeoxyribonuclease VII large subunit
MIVSSDPITTPAGQRLAEFLTELQTTIVAAFPITRQEWIRAEIVAINQPKGHWKLELEDRDGDGNPLAKITAWLWQKASAPILNKFRSVTGNDLRPGISVLLQVSVNFRPDKGLALIIHDIDPTFTVGQMELKLAAIRERLIQEKVWHKNQQLPPPTEFCRVAVISPANAAGLGDFQTIAEKLHQHKLCEFDYFSAPFQGEGAAAKLVDMLRTVFRQNREQPYDAVVIIRGGGAKSDLYDLNDYELAKAVAHMPTPVLVGIGHDRDRTILDEVANQRFATPSLVAEHIRKAVITNAQTAAKSWQRIANLAQQRADRANHETERSLRQVQTAARQQLLTANNKLEIAYRQATKNAASYLEKLQVDIRQWTATVINAGPQRVLKRGYSVVRDATTNKPLTRALTAGQHRCISIEFLDGRIQALPIPPNLSIGEKGDPNDQ